MHNFVGDPAADSEYMVGEWKDPVEVCLADYLIDRIVPTDVFAYV
jgi:hypothetical protein